MNASRRTRRSLGIALLITGACAWLVILMFLAIGPVGTAARHVPSMLGMFGSRTWLVLLQNPAEARGTGGLVGGYLVVRIDHGRFRVVASGSSADLERHSIPLAGADPDQVAFWGPILSQWNGFNVTPDFAVAASLAKDGMHAMGVEIDGVMAVDPFAVAALMESTGPVTAGGRSLSSETVARYFLIHEYLDYRSGRTRDVAGMSLVRAIVDTVTSNPWALVAALPRIPALIDGDHLRVWSSLADEQSWLTSTNLGGSALSQPAPSVVVAFNNAAGNKADAFVSTSVDYSVPVCETLTDAPSHLTIRARNDMPRGMPIKDYGRRDRSDAPAASTSLLVHVFAPVGATNPSVTLNGKSATMAWESLGNRPAWWTTLELPRATQVTLTIEFREPVVPDRVPVVIVTPMVRPTLITAAVQSDCS